VTTCEARDVTYLAEAETHKEERFDQYSRYAARLVRGVHSYIAVTRIWKENVAPISKHNDKVWYRQRDGTDILLGANTSHVESERL
jgi:hypothetical protein